MSKPLLDILLKEKIIAAPQYQEALDSNKSSPENFVPFLIQKKYVNEAKLLQFLSQKYGLPSINLAKYDINPEVIKTVPVEVARKYRIIPIQHNKGILVCAICDPTTMLSLEDIKFRTRMNVEAVITTFSAVDAALTKYYTGSASMAEAVQVFQNRSEREDFVEQNQAIIVDAGAATDKDAPVISLVNQILVEAIRRNASDIHIESYEHSSRVRLRVDGVLLDVIQVPPEIKRPLIARIKIMAKLDIAESRLPQDGRIKIKVGAGEVDFRVSTMPCLFGEKAVLRLLAKGNLNWSLSKLGFESRSLELFRKGIAQPNGMVLVTGPTGSGKTTTLYAALAEVNSPKENISTVEDPVEYNLDGVNQVQVNKDIGLTFASVLRAFLRQDPDTILVGEIRDLETAEVAIQAALTGHLVLSTIHTNDAPSSILRLTNMGVEPFLVTAAVSTIVAQRLLRVICPKCKEPANLPVSRLTAVGIPEAVASQVRPMQGKGCNFCNKTGYRGRVAVYEVMDFNSTLKEMVLAHCTGQELKRAAIKEGMRTLRVAALQKVADGLTTLEEAISMTSSD